MVKGFPGASEHMGRWSGAKKQEGTHGWECLPCWEFQGGMPGAWGQGTFAREFSALIGAWVPIQSLPPVQGWPHIRSSGCPMLLSSHCGKVSLCLESFRGLLLGFFPGWEWPNFSPDPFLLVCPESIPWGQISQPGDLEKGLRTLREFDFEGQWNLISELPQDWVNRLMEGANKTLCSP